VRAECWMPSSFSSDLRYIKKNKQLFLSQWRCHFGSKPTDPRSIAVVAETCSTLQSSTKREREEKDSSSFFFFLCFGGLNICYCNQDLHRKMLQISSCSKNFGRIFVPHFFACVCVCGARCEKRKKSLFPHNVGHRTHTHTHTHTKKKTKDKRQEASM